MIRTVVVPLDGSQLAETALEPARHIANRLRVPLHLVRVYEPQVHSVYVSGAPVLDSQLDRDLRAAELTLLQEIASREGRHADAGVTVALLDGPVVKALADHVASLVGALVVMTTHGRTGLGRAHIGGVTDGLVRSTTVPVLSIRVFERKPAARSPGEFRRVLIPLEGAHFGLQIVDLAVEVAGATGTEYVPMHVVSPVPVMPPPEPPIPLPEQEVAMEERLSSQFLAALSEPLRARGIAVTTKVVVDPDPTRAILGFADEAAVDLICMPTHAYSGYQRLLFGSVAEKVMRASPVPVLLLRPPGEGIDG